VRRERAPHAVVETNEETKGRKRVTRCRDGSVSVTPSTSHETLGMHHRWTNFFLFGCGHEGVHAARQAREYTSSDPRGIFPIWSGYDFHPDG